MSWEMVGTGSYGDPPPKKKLTNGMPQTASEAKSLTVQDNIGKIIDIGKAKSCLLDA